MKKLRVTWASANGTESSLELPPAALITWLALMFIATGFLTANLYLARLQVAQLEADKRHLILEKAAAAIEAPSVAPASSALSSATSPTIANTSQTANSSDSAKNASNTTAPKIASNQDSSTAVAVNITRLTPRMEQGIVDLEWSIQVSGNEPVEGRTWLEATLQSPSGKLTTVRSPKRQFFRAKRLMTKSEALALPQDFAEATVVEGRVVVAPKGSDTNITKKWVATFPDESPESMR